MISIHLTKGYLETAKSDWFLHKLTQHYCEHFYCLFKLLLKCSFKH